MDLTVHADTFSAPEGMIALEYFPVANYVLNMNGFDTIRRLTISNTGANAWTDTKVTLSGDLLLQSSATFDTIGAGDSVDLSDRIRVTLDHTRLMQLTESDGIFFTITVEIGKTEAFSRKYALMLTAYDHWMGTRIRPELTAAFVTPNHPLVARIAASASQKLAAATGDGSLNAYHSGDPNRVRMQVAAIFEAIRDENISYVTAPASFEAAGQRIRTADKVLSDKMATCIDLSLLMASVLEAAGIRPIIIFTSGHCFAGAWLVRDSYFQSVGDDAGFLLKGLADGVNDIVAFETTFVTAPAHPSFEDAVTQARAQLADENTFECFVDIARARVNNVRPIPLRISDEKFHTTDTDTHTAGTEVRLLDRYDLSAYDRDTSAVTKYTVWERKLLDFTLRNSLLNIRTGRRTIPLLSFAIDSLENYLADGKTFTIREFPLDETPQPGERGIYDSTRYPMLEPLVVEQMSQRRLHSFLSDERLRDSLKYLYRAARTSLEENGASNLYLALGLLRWLDADNSSEAHYAPILLIPVDIVRSSGINNYSIRARDEEVSLNITLSELLRQQHDIDLSAINVLPSDESGVDVKRIFAFIREKIRTKKGWNVLDESMLGIFSFNKFVMWRDIHANSESLHSHEIIASLVDGRLHTAPDDDSVTDAKAADADMNPAEYAIPIDVDSSQLEAIIASAESKSFILHGPPGTGKSQTITNIIANALFQGRRVLFVAEKMAALEVVQSRLEKIGLAPFCLELHSNKASKQHFLSQLARALDVERTQADVDYASMASQVFDSRRDLLDTIEALHATQPSGLSLYDCIERAMALSTSQLPTPQLPLLPTPAQAEANAELIRGAGTVMRVIGTPNNHPFARLPIKYDGANSEIETIRIIRDFLADSSFMDDLLLKYGTDKKAAEIDVFKSNGNFTSFLGSIILDRDSGSDERKKIVAAFRKSSGQRFLLRKQYGQGAVMRIESGYISSLRSRWTEARRKWFIPRYFATKAIVKELAPITFIENFSCNDVPDLIENLEKALQADNEYIGLLPGTLLRYNQFFSLIAGSDITLGEVTAEADKWLRNEANLRRWNMWQHTRTEIVEKCGADVARMLDAGMNPDEMANAYLRAFYTGSARRIIDADRRLMLFNGLVFEDIIKKYRSLTRQMQQLSKEALFFRLASKLPSLTMLAHESSEIGILRRNIRNGGRGRSIRSIIDAIPELLPKLCPCMLMSPISVAQFLNIDAEKFDIVIFDEASQMPTSEAVGAIARGKTLIVVGDPMQMPPTSFFSTQAVGEDEAHIDDMESILDDCMALSMPSRHLTWHYRSRHESLITFSNQNYYDGRLTTFPSTDNLSSRVVLRRVAGIYDRSRSRCNRVEAEAVVEEVLRRLAHPSLSRQSIGIVAFSKVQQDKIEDMLNAALASRPGLQEKAYESAEPIFVKNLENVQGDERDVILFSVGYGPDPTGRMSMNFGPLNIAGGERRLNVAVSRARFEMIVFSSIDPEQIDLQRTGARGVAGLRRFLEYARDGQSGAMLAATSATSAPVKAVAEYLRQKGYEVDTNVGCSRFKVDIAVRAPGEESAYMAGIIFDGRRYYETKTVRDREVVQPSVLESLGWTVLRVWTLDLYEHPADTLAMIETHLAECAANPVQPEIAAEPEPEIETQDDYCSMKLHNIDSTDSKLKQPEPVNTRCEPYPVATFISPYQTKDINSLISHGLADMLREIIATEAPITSDLLYKRVVRAYGLTRVSPRLQAVVDSTLRLTNAISTPNGQSGRTYWSDTVRPEGYDRYRTDSGRDFADVPLVEVENAMLYVIGQQISLSTDDLKRLTAYQLGYTRKGTVIETITAAIVEQLKARGAIKVDGDKASAV